MERSESDLRLSAEESRNGPSSVGSADEAVDVIEGKVKFAYGKAWHEHLNGRGIGINKQRG
jgi:hypothetical protein